MSWGEKSFIAGYQPEPYTEFYKKTDIIIMDHHTLFPCIQFLSDLRDAKTIPLIGDLPDETAKKIKSKVDPQIKLGADALIKLAITYLKKAYPYQNTEVQNHLKAFENFFKKIIKSPSTELSPDDISTIGLFFPKKFRPPQ